ncbi:MAG: prenyltransferase/squalene oxidase repeat-containing protein [Deferrisomatales bacterium]|nr:prenyltransferase/squalene oxidase repeat-containing protein [Deferrisomatales bacterium]
MRMKDTLLSPLRRWRDERRLSPAARAERSRDRQGLPEVDPGAEAAVEAALGWLGRAQDCSRSGDGGVSRHYSLIDGWAASYPETTGYIVPTMLEQGEARGDPEWIRRARRMLDWLVSIQFPEGGFQGGSIGSTPRVPVTFNTGQILLGLAAGAKRWAVYRQPMERAAEWLVRSQSPDGSWSGHPSPFVKAGAKTYDTHVAWGLLEAARRTPGSPYAESALANVRWALSHQRGNGWFDSCCLNDPERPLTHTIGYALRGVLEAYAYDGDPQLLSRARLTADALAGVLERHGRLPGRLDERWQPAVAWSCLTGSAQIAHCWLLLYAHTGETRYRDAGFAANALVRRTVSVTGAPDVRGGVKGSFPVDGAYGRYQYLNWAAKFLIDANTLEATLRRGGSRGACPESRGGGESESPTPRLGSP